MLTLEQNMGAQITCKFCQHNSEIQKLIGQEIVHKKVFNQKKEWLTGPWEKKEKERPMIEEDCPNEKCDSRKLYYSTAQLRSVDEGQTVFYECVKCGYAYSVNT